MNTKYRSNATELMDDFTLEGELLRDTFDKLELINRLLGGNRVTLNGIKKILKNHPKDTKITIIDIGCGHGDILRDVAKFGRNKGYHFQLIGVDANTDAITYANELSTNYKEIEFLNIDVFSKKYESIACDIVLCTLFLHHFSQEELIKILKTNYRKAVIGLVINDLHRSKFAYYLFKLISSFSTNHMIKKDGLTSILKAFKRKELVDLTRQLQAKGTISWKWAFRYQWILTKQ